MIPVGLEFLAMGGMAQAEQNVHEQREKTIGIDLRFLGGTLVGFGRTAPEDLRNAGMDAQQRNADAYRAAMSSAQPALVRPDDLRNVWPCALPTHHPTHQTDLILRALRRPDWLYFGWLTAMAGVALIRAGWMLLR